MCRVKDIYTYTNITHRYKRHAVPNHNHNQLEWKFVLKHTTCTHVR